MFCCYVEFVVDVFIIDFIKKLKKYYGGWLMVLRFRWMCYDVFKYIYLIILNVFKKRKR